MQNSTERHNAVFQGIVEPDDQTENAINPIAYGGGGGEAFWPTPSDKKSEF